MRALAVLLILLVATPAWAPAPAAARSVAATADLRLEGAPNFREIGGYATTDGRRVVRGLVYRSDKMSALTAGDIARIRNLGIRNVIDLRTIEERRSEPDAWRARNVYESPKMSLSSSFAALRDPAVTPDTIRGVMTASYAQMPANYADEYRVMFRRLVDGGAPMIVHCTAGKDRTGVGIALLLSALGVPRATVMQDYLISNDRLPRRAGEVSVAGVSRPEVSRVLLGVETEWLAAALDAVDAQYGSIDGYLRQVMGLTPRDIATLRRRLTR